MKTSLRFLILGAGPAGLTMANRLKQNGENDFLVLEKEHEAGGLCRSTEVDGSPFDIGGGHFLDVQRPKANEFLFRFLPKDEWNLFDRDSRIVIGNNIINHPIEANIWQMDIDSQKVYLDSISKAGCNIGMPMPEKFVDWIYWKLGERIAEDYMIPYNQKMFGENLNSLGTYWLEKLPNVSYEETKLSCKNHKPFGTQPGHAQFFYPKNFGYGELWHRMSVAIEGKIKYNKTIKTIDFKTNTVKTADGEIFKANNIIVTIPWKEFDEIVGMPDTIKSDIDELKYSSIQTEYFENNIDSDAHWIYYPNLNVTYHRILLRHNFCEGSRGYWTETNSDRVVADKDASNFKFLNKYAYPLNTIGKPEIMSRLLSWSEEHNVIGLGRWGEHKHYNSDVVVELAIDLADRLLKY